MQKNKIHILSTGQVDKDLIEEGSKRNIIIDEIPFISIEPLINNTLKENIENLSLKNINVVFTSLNAVEVVSKHISNKSSWKIFCIGNMTKNLVAELFGSENIIGHAESANQLAQKIIEDTSIKAVTFFCGYHRRDELPEKLKTNGVAVEEIIVYNTKETPHVIKKEYDGILFYSPSAVNSFFIKNNISEKIQLFAIGSTTADALKHFTPHPVIIAEMPGKENLIHLAIDHFSKSKIS
jgi:uroporphyrinogen-III synthase